MSYESHELMHSENAAESSTRRALRRVAGPAICAALAMGAVQAMASTDERWDAGKLSGSKDGAADEGDRVSALAEHVVSGPRASQAMGLAWHDLAERMEVDGRPLADIYAEAGLGGFVKTAGPADDSANTGACYSACYGNCYGNCYSNCYGNCHGADG